MKACGKVILFGEHAVVYGHPALAAALTLGVSVTATDAGADRVTVAAWDLDTADPEHAAVVALARIKAALGVDRGVHVVGDADLPARAGLGSSAALCVAIARALAPDAGIDAHQAAADAGEAVFHHNPSGVDVALALHGGTALYRKATGLEPQRLPQFPLVIGLTGEPRDTAKMVAQVATLRDNAPRETERRLRALGDLAVAGRDALANFTLWGLGALFDEAQNHLAALGLSSPGIEHLVSIAKQSGAFGAKLTGAGGGGAVIAVALEHDQRVLAAWRAAGFRAFIAEVGVR